MKKLFAVCSIALLAAGLCAQSSRKTDNDPNKKKEVKRNVFKEKIASKNYPESNKRIKKINDTVRQFLDRNEKLGSPAVQETIFAEVAKFVPLNPSEKLDLRKFDDFQKIILPKVNQKFPLERDAIRKEAEKLAEEKFTMYQPMDKVKVRYQRGRTVYAVEGNFYGYGGGSIQVNEKHIAMFDLLPESRLKFDKAYNQKTKQEFIDQYIQDYLNKKYSFSNDLLRKEQDIQRRNNEKSGYIYADRKWQTARKLTEEAIAEAKVEADRRAKEAAEKAAQDLKNKVKDAVNTMSTENVIRNASEF